ncbi:MAG: DUF5011 domain-containing protein [Enterococcus lacertideformus]|uniref:DUF5011 domain-containing protein n=1 Tax=Enterococcus lacertideformus TaxID=2771493 RepID=A0A931B1G0_9ENTE|nr:DUF5011 domain-containing protein [Enterococcus lacertideformus]
MKRFVFKSYLSKKNKTKLVYALFAFFIGGWGIGIISQQLKRTKEEPIRHQQMQVATILSDISEKKNENKAIAKNYFLEESQDPAVSVFDQFDYSPPKKESLNSMIQQLESEVNQLILAFTKEKNKKEESLTTLEISKEIPPKNIVTKKEIPAIQPLEPQPEETPTESQSNWQPPQLFIYTSQVVIEQYSHFEPTNYFKIIIGHDPAPKVEHNFIDTSKLGEQKLMIQVTDSTGTVSYNEISFFINSAPILQLKQPVLEQRIGQPLDLLKGIFAFNQEDGVLTSKVTFETDLDINKEGDYDVNYSIVDRHGARATAQAVIKIVNEAPVINLPALIDHKINHPLNLLEHIKVSDIEDGVIQLHESNIIETNFDFKKEGSYFFKIGNVKDKHGKFANEKTIIVRVTNEEPKIIQATMQVDAFSLLKVEDFLAELVISDREDPVDSLKIELDEHAWNQIDTTKLREYVIPIKVTDTNGKTTSDYGKIKVINEPPKFIGVVDRELIIGENFDSLTGIKVYDKEELLSLEDVEIIETADINLPGIYTIILKVRDSFEQITASYQLTVIDEQKSEEGEG